MRMCTSFLSGVESREQERGKVFEVEPLVMFEHGEHRRQILGTVTKPVFLGTTGLRSTLDTQANNTRGERVPRQVHHGETIVPKPHTSHTLQPTDRALHHPPHLAQSAAMLPVSPRNHGLDPEPTQDSACRSRIVSAIGIQFPRARLGRSRLASDLGKSQHCGRIWP
jgi:hypothetical protein